MTKAVVTGGAGFIGSHLVDELVHRGIAVSVIDNLSLGKRDNVNAAASFHCGNAGNFFWLKGILADEKPDIMFALATVPLPASFDRPQFVCAEIHALGLAACEFARTGLVSRLVMVSSSEAYGTACYVPMDEAHPYHPTTPYAAAKAAVDLLTLSYVKTFGIDAVIARPFNAYGPRQNFGAYAGVIPGIFRTIHGGGPPTIYGDGKQTRDFCYVTDIACAIANIGLSDNVSGLVINIASGQELKIETLVDRLCAKTGYGGRIFRGPERLGDTRRHLGDISLLKSKIGFEAVVPLEAGLDKTLGWFEHVFKYQENQTVDSPCLAAAYRGGK